MSTLIFISDSITDIEQVQQFATDNSYALEYYSKEEWGKFIKKQQSKRAVSNIPTLSIVESSDTTTVNNNLLILKTMNDIKVEAIKSTLLRARGNASKAAEILKIGRATLYRKIKELNIDLDSIREYSKEDIKVRPALKKAA